MSGINIGNAALHILEHSTDDGPNGPTIWTATDRLRHLKEKATKDDLLEAVAYLAMQANTYRRISNQDAHLAMVNVESIVREYKERRK